jgi:hypothetical protein
VSCTAVPTLEVLGSIADSGALKVLVIGAIVAAILLTRLGPRGR